MISISETHVIFDFVSFLILIFRITVQTFPSVRLYRKPRYFIYLLYYIVSTQIIILGTRLFFSLLIGTR